MTFRAHLVFQQFTPEAARRVIAYLQESERAAYQATLASLAAKKKLRPVFVQRKSRPEQCDWILATLKQPSADETAEQVLQIFLMKGRQPMLVAFLDAMGIAHDGEGSVEDLPEELDAGKLPGAVQALQADFPPEEVALYLTLFNQQRPGGWPAFNDLMAADPSLRIGFKTGD